ncbi:RabGAP/TBC domain-containing protein [Tieghemostelium lacteum]|uniref:RabGAP/TBC domain-containing protein n=1 Tax=Tieghemostelium lacteum TaxID=361077 RepID=A0A151ZB58_TIELA|nr:RabGAP/TBC domain-containing protein [Tieghemostelium lacteum]|eukprot:KYQ91165.1 RabGAP/TBC domain-containing protein [Tieghemostelium lacteum]
MATNLNYLKDSEPFLISNRFSNKEIEVFEKIFKNIDKQTKGYITKDDYDKYIEEFKQSQSKTQNEEDNVNLINNTIEYEKLLVFNSGSNNVSFYNFLSMLSLSGISLTIKEPIVKEEPQPINFVSNPYRRSIVTNLKQQKDIKDMIESIPNSNTPTSPTKEQSITSSSDSIQAQSPDNSTTKTPTTNTENNSEPERRISRMGNHRQQSPK